MTNPLIIVITGPPGTGKTTLGRMLEARYNLPLLYRDGIKELLFDHIGWSDTEWSKKLGIASYKLLLYSMELLFQTKQPFIVESNFYPEFNEKDLKEIIEKYSYKTLQIHCNAKNETILKRFRTRSYTTERHPGHGYLGNDELLDRLENNAWGVLNIDSTILSLDTTNFSEINYNEIFSEIDFLLDSK